MKSCYERKKSKVALPLVDVGESVLLRILISEKRVKIKIQIPDSDEVSFSVKGTWYLRYWNIMPFLRESALVLWNWLIDD